ncbi:MAG: hypothetical protein ABIY52_18980 [Gemmatimonadaceae bacterium]
MFTYRATIAAGLIALSSHIAAAQVSAPGARTWEFRVTGGAFVPTGGQRSVLADAQATAAQLSWLVRPSLALTGTFGWARSRDVASIDSPKLDVFTSDVGVEVRPVPWFAERAVSFSPFAGMGAGARSYNYRNLDVDATNNLAGYVSAGGELGVRRVGLRLEVRDYATGFKPLAGTGTPATGNDVVFMVGVRFNRQVASQQ